MSGGRNGACGLRGLARSFQYSGTGSAILIQGAFNPNPPGYIYRVNLKDFGLFSTGSAAIGIEAHYLEEFQFSGLQLGWDDSTSFSKAIYCGHCAIGAIRGNMFSHNPTGIDFDWVATSHNATLDVSNNNIFHSTTAAFHVGDLSYSTFRDNHVEDFQTAFLLDTVSTVGGSEMIEVSIQGGNYSDVGYSYTQPRFLKMASLDTSKYLYWRNGSIRDVTVSLGTLAGAYTIETALASNVSGQSYVQNVQVSQSALMGGSTSAIYSDSSAASFLLTETECDSGFLTPAIACTSGTGTYASVSLSASLLTLTAPAIKLAGPTSIYGTTYIQNGYLSSMFRDSGVAVTAGGLIRLVSYGNGTWAWQMNTAAGGDFSSATTPLQFQAGKALMILPTSCSGLATRTLYDTGSAVGFCP